MSTQTYIKYASIDGHSGNSGQGKVLSFPCRSLFYPDVLHKFSAKVKGGAMKISQSGVGLSSSYTFEQEEKLQEKRSSTTTSQGRFSSKRNRGFQNNNGQPLVMVDRVSISGAAIRESTTEYGHALSSQSNVRIADSNETVDFSQQEMVEKLVSNVVKEQISSINLTALGPGQQVGTDRISSKPAGAAKTTMSIDRTTSRFEQEEMTFASQGQVLTEDGRAINFSLELAMDRTSMTKTSEQALISTWQEEVALIDPLIINLEGGVPALSDTRFEFDLDNDGATEEISFAASGSGFLSFDKNNDGIINNGSELFGPGTGNGFDELAAYDLDANGWIDENDDVFTKLSVWTRDDAGNDVLVSLADAGIGAVYLDNTDTDFQLTDADNVLAGEVSRSGIFLFENGNVGMIQQIDLAARSQEPEMVSEQESPADLPPAVNPPRTIFKALGNEPSWSREQVWQTEAENFLKEMMEQLREMEKQIRRILNIEPKSGSR